MGILDNFGMLLVVMFAYTTLLVGFFYWDAQSRRRRSFRHWRRYFTGFRS